MCTSQNGAEIALDQLHSWAASLHRRLDKLFVWGIERTLLSEGTGMTLRAPLLLKRTVLRVLCPEDSGEGTLMVTLTAPEDCTRASSRFLFVPDGWLSFVESIWLHFGVPSTSGLLRLPSSSQAAVSEAFSPSLATTSCRTPSYISLTHSLLLRCLVRHSLPACFLASWTLVGFNGMQLVLS